MNGGRTHYVPKDAGWWRRSRIIELGQQHGPAGPAVIDWLTCEARTQGPIRRHDGSVKSGYAAIAHGVFLPSADQAREIVQAAVEIGLLDDMQEHGRTFTCRISGWRNDVDTRLEADRRAAQRAAEAARDGSGTAAGDNGRHSGDNGRQPPDLSPNVPGEGEEKENNDTSLRSVSARTGEAADPPDDWPTELPGELRPVAEHVHRRLTGLAQAKSVEAPAMRRVGLVIADYPDHDHRAIVGDVVDYWQHGKGAKTVRKDLARVYRDRCSRVVAAPAVPVNGADRVETPAEFAAKWRVTR